MSFINNFEILMNTYGLSEDEKIKAREKFLAPLARLTDKELTDILEFFKIKNIKITKAREIKVFANGIDEIRKKFSILDEIDEADIYRQDPTKFNHNVIDIYKKIKYCRQSGIPYRKREGSYENFLFDEALWQQVTSKVDEVVTPVFSKVEEDIVTLTPESAPLDFANDGFKNPVENSMDIQEYIAAEAQKEDIEAKTTTFDIIQDELEAQNLENEISKLTADRKELENFQKDISKLTEKKEALEDFQKQLSELDTISFNDLDFGTESFGGR